MVGACEIDIPPMEREVEAMMFLVMEQPRATSEKVFISAFVETDLNSLLKNYKFWY